jgi:hypothetical protein
VTKRLLSGDSDCRFDKRNFCFSFAIKCLPTAFILVCDVFSLFAPAAKASLHELCRVMALLSKPGAINGTDVDRYFREGRIREIADYCESDVVNTYRVWLLHELFQREVTEAGYEASEALLEEFITARKRPSILA